MPAGWVVRKCGEKKNTKLYTTTKDTYDEQDSYRAHGIQYMVTAAVAAVGAVVMEFVIGTDVKLLINVDLLNCLIIKTKPHHRWPPLKQKSFSGYKK